MTVTQSEKANAFVALHQRTKPFVIANAFDGCSARMMASLGFEAVATSSWVQAAMLGKHDGATSRAEAIAHAKAIVEATELPVSADLERGFGDKPEDVATTIREAGAIGLVGCSIEDASSDTAKPIYEFDYAIQRIEAAVAAARDLPFKFTLTARTENFVRGINNLDDTIRRLQAFEAAGADVLMAPGLPDLEAIKTVCSSLENPFNYMIGIPGKAFSVEQLAEAGVARISLATSLYATALAATYNAAHEISQSGTFSYVDEPFGIDLGSFLKENSDTPM